MKKLGVSVPIYIISLNSGKIIDIAKIFFPNSILKKENFYEFCKMLVNTDHSLSLTKQIYLNHLSKRLAVKVNSFVFSEIIINDEVTYGIIVSYRLNPEVYEKYDR